jgi:two-component system, NtrC family, nitrogen regulation sensor histidine kinase NtrY
MAEGATECRRTPARSLPEALVRTLRHEMGDFLQKVYATVAILKARLPAESEMEHGLLGRLRARAETCKDVLDAAHDYVCTVMLDCEPVDLVALTRELVTKLSPRFGQLEIRCEAAGAVLANADPRRAAQVIEALLLNACEAARAKVVCRLTPHPDRNEVEWTVVDDGPGFPTEQSDRLFSPFFTTKAGHAGLGLALARKLVELHGGRIVVGNEPGDGFKASITFPAEPAPEPPAR